MQQPFASQNGGQQYGQPQQLALHDQMQQMNIGQPPPLVRSKKSARAYHIDEPVTPQAYHQQPTVQPAYQQQQQSQQFPQQQQHHQQQQYDQQGGGQQPVYFDPSQAQFQQQQHQPNDMPQPVPFVAPELVDTRLSGQPRGNIAQPPHDAGARMNGPRSKIDPDAIPSPVYVRNQDQARLDANSGLFFTGSGDLTPASLTDFIAVDQGNCSPRFIRMTTYTFPHSDDLATAGQLPLALVVQPFAEVRPGEMPVQIADFSAENDSSRADLQPGSVAAGSGTGGQGPPRCSHCKAYINPFFAFLDGGSKYRCNLCAGVSEVPAEYFSHLDMQGRRLDIEQRPELLYGSIDFLVPSAYWVQPTAEEIASQTPVASTSKHQPPMPSPGALSPGLNPNLPAPSPLLSFAGLSSNQSSSKKAGELSRPPEPMKYVFAIDVSWAAGRSGMLRQVSQALKEAFYGETEERKEGRNGHDEATEEEPPQIKSSLPPGAKIAIVTFDKTIHFYHLKSNLEQPQMMVVPDLDDMFAPLHEGLLVDPHESRHAIENLLDNLDSMFRETPITEAALGGAIKAGLTLLKQLGGQLNIFQTTLPTLGPGSLKQREDNKLYGTDKERALFAAQDPFYRQVAEECADAGIGVNLFVSPIQYVDIASIGVLTGITGGEIFFHPRFDPVREGRKYRSEIKGVISRETGYSVTMRVRCSEGLRIADHIGNFFQRNPTDLEFGTIDADKAIAAIVKHDSKLTERADAHFQVALLYTSASGERRVRCHNIVVGVSTKLGDVFRTADMDTTIAIVAKDAMTQTLSKTLAEVRNHLTDRCVKILLAYRKHCAASVAAGQLILPECFKLFPVYTLALSKLKAIKGGQVVSDVRTYFMRLVKSMSVAACVELFYPRFFPLHVLHPDDCSRTQEGRFIMPHTVRLSYERMEAHGCYLIENGETAILWLGAAVSPQLLQDLYGVDDLTEINTHMTYLPNLPTQLSQQVRALVEELESRQRHRKLQIAIARQGMDGTEMEFANMLSEDANNDSLAYADFLSHVHKQIQQNVINQAKEAEAEQSALWRGVW